MPWADRGYAACSSLGSGLASIAADLRGSPAGGITFSGRPNRPIGAALPGLAVTSAQHAPNCRAPAVRCRRRGAAHHR